MRPTLARAVRDHEAAGNAVDEAVAEAVWADGEGEAAAMDVVDDAPAMGAVDEAAVAEAVGEGGRVKSGRPRETQQQKLARIKRELEAVPTEPGVYLWKDAAGEVIYVGKEKPVRESDDRAKISLARGVIDFRIASLLPTTSMRRLPRRTHQRVQPALFNADSKDNKSYPSTASSKAMRSGHRRHSREHKSDTKYFVSSLTPAPPRVIETPAWCSSNVPPAPITWITCGRITRRFLEALSVRVPVRHSRWAGPRRSLRGPLRRGGVRPERAAHRALPAGNFHRSSVDESDGGNAGGRQPDFERADS